MKNSGDKLKQKSRSNPRRGLSALPQRRLHHRRDLTGRRWGDTECDVENMNQSKPKTNLNPLNQLVDDKKQNKYLFAMFVLTLLFSPTLLIALMLAFMAIFIASSEPGKSLFSIESYALLQACNCLTYSVTGAIALGAGWYFFGKKRYTPVLIITFILPIAFLITLIVYFVI
jgi:maltodextrin utilization protein YvdJ